MKPRARERVASLLADPPAAAGLAAGDWAVVVQQARRAGLLGRLAERLQAEAPRVTWPLQVGGHFESALRLSRTQQAEIQREVQYLMRALDGLAVPVVLLKGAAYAMAGLPSASGRVFGDVDILVPKRALAQVESRLLAHGWLGSHHDAYDQRYYRQWMHELPPMQHMHRGTVLDVHHGILPETARLRPDPRKLFERVLPVPGQQGLFVLAPEDMVLHSMTHLFLNDDMNYALRDLSDLDLLLRHFAQRGGFWDDLRRRAEALDLRRPLYYGLRHTARLLRTPVDPGLVAATRDFGPPAVVGRAMDAVWARALRSQHPSARPRGAGAALFALYLRGHWLRMPLPMLARHLATKAWMRLDKARTDPLQPVP